MNDMNNDGPALDSNPQPLAYQANALPTELLGLTQGMKDKEARKDKERRKDKEGRIRKDKEG